MSLDLYTPELSRLAAGNPFEERLAAPHATVEKRSPICGSRVTVDVAVDDAGRVIEVGMLVRACLLGQASSSLLAANIVGRNAAQLAIARDQLTAWLARAGARPDWPGIDVFEAGLDKTARHASIRLAFEAAAEAAAIAADARVRGQGRGAA